MTKTRLETIDYHIRAFENHIGNIKVSSLYHPYNENYEIRVVDLLINQTHSCIIKTDAFLKEDYLGGPLMSALGELRDRIHETRSFFDAKKKRANAKVDQEAYDKIEGYGSF